MLVRTLDMLQPTVGFLLSWNHELRFWGPSVVEGLLAGLVLLALSRQLERRADRRAEEKTARRTLLFELSERLLEVDYDQPSKVYRECKEQMRRPEFGDLPRALRARVERLSREAKKAADARECLLPSICTALGVNGIEDRRIEVMGQFLKRYPTDGMVTDGAVREFADNHYQKPHELDERQVAQQLQVADLKKVGTAFRDFRNARSAFARCLDHERDFLRRHVQR